MGVAKAAKAAKARESFVTMPDTGARASAIGGASAAPPESGKKRAVSFSDTAPLVGRAAVVGEAPPAAAAPAPPPRAPPGAS